jgi:cellulose synthase/poly-beta-1,6-N-acetylglucosamine synthase-like glycosyltransferase
LLLELAALILAAIHFGVPIVYYWHAKRKWLPKPWDVRVDESYRPKVTIVVPTHDEMKPILRCYKSLLPSKV